MLKVEAVAPTVDIDAIKTLFNNLDLVMSHSGDIVDTSEFYGIKIKGTFVCGLYVGGHDLLLGDLVVLWTRTSSWHKDNKYYYSIIGSPLSGSNSSCWWNAETKKLEQGSYNDGKRGFGGLAWPAFNYIQHGSFTTGKANVAYETDKAPQFGKIYTSVPPNRTVSPLTIYDLVKKLQR